MVNTPLGVQTIKWLKVKEVSIGTTGRVSNAIGYRHDRSGLQRR